MKETENNITNIFFDPYKLIERFQNFAVIVNPEMKIFS